MFDALKDIAALVKELNLGIGGFFALCFMAIFIWGAKRTSSFAHGLAGEWKRLIDEGEQVRLRLRTELNEAHKALAEKDQLIEEMRRDYASLNRKYYALEARMRFLENRQEGP